MKYIHGGSKELVQLLEALGVPTENLTRFNLMCGVGELVTVHAEYTIPISEGRMASATDLVKTLALVVK